MNVDKKQWREGPSMLERRQGLAASRCNRHLYVCGGFNGNDSLATIERIAITDLLHTTTTTTTTTSGWEKLNCQLSRRRHGCAASSVLNRYIIVMGGFDGFSRLSCIDIVDTGAVQTVVVSSTVKMGSTRHWASCEVISDRIFVVGGKDNSGFVMTNAVECLEFNSQDKESHTDSHINNISQSNADSILNSSSPWSVENHTQLHAGFFQQIAMTKVGSSLVVAGSANPFRGASVEVLDVNRRVAWSLPNLTVPRNGCSMVTLSSCILVIGGQNVDSVESMPLSSKHDPKPPGQYCNVGSGTDIVASAKELSFYNKLVETNDDHIIIKVHELATLVFSVHNVTVFYTFLNQLFRSGHMTADERRRYTSRALQRIADGDQVLDKQIRIMLAHVIQKCDQDGTVNLDLLKKLQAIAMEASTTSLPVVDAGKIRQQISNAGFVFRVGKVVVNRQVDESVEATQDQQQQSQKNRILLHVQPLGWTLKQLHEAYFQGRQREVSIAAICSILNACSFCVLAEHGDNANTSSASQHFGVVITQIVDFGDAGHIVSVVERSGDETLKDVCSQGIAIVERVTGAAATNTYPSAEDANTASEILVAILGQLANATTKLIRNGSGEAATILALIVTAKLVEASECVIPIKTEHEVNVKAGPDEIRSGNNDDAPESVSGFDVEKNVDDNVQKQVGDDVQNPVSSTSPPRAQTSELVSPSSSLHSTKESSVSILIRLQNLEATMGVAHRVESLERFYRVRKPNHDESQNTCSMTVGDRVAQLEKLLESQVL